VIFKWNYILCSHIVFFRTGWNIQTSHCVFRIDSLFFRHLLSYCLPIKKQIIPELWFVPHGHFSILLHEKHNKKPRSPFRTHYVSMRLRTLFPFTTTLYKRSMNCINFCGTKAQHLLLCNRKHNIFSLLSHCQNKFFFPMMRYTLAAHCKYT